MTRQEGKEKREEKERTAFERKHAAKTVKRNKYEVNVAQMVL